MLTLYDDKTIGNKEYIKDIEASFAFYKDAIVKLPQLKEVCSTIDNISYIKGAYIETPFGATSIDDLSTGCKALLLAILLSAEDIIVSFVESGENVLSFALRKGYKINIYCLSTLQVNKEANKCEFIYAGKTMTIKEYHSLEV